MADKSTLAMLRENERETRRKLIIDAAVRLFAKKSFYEVHMRDIAREAGISPASIYRYFSDQDQLFLAAFTQRAEEVVQRLENLAENNPSLEEMALSFVDYLLENDSFFQMMTHFMMESKIKEDSLEGFNTTGRRLLDVFEGTLKKAGVTENTRTVSHAFFAALNGILITFRRYPGRDEQETREHMRRLARLIAKAFAGEVGRGPGK